MYILQHESNLRTIRGQQTYILSMSELDRFINNLSGLDTSDHSKKYKQFENCLNQLYNCCLSISEKCPPDGMDPDPAGMLKLRDAYDKTILAARDYLKNKDRKTDNDVYRRRYDTVDKLIEVLEKDRRILGEQRPDISYRPEDALKE